MRLVQLTRGKYAIIDSEDFSAVECYKWNYSNSGYAKTAVPHPTIKGRQSYLYMHTLLMSTPKGMHVDHKDGNSLNNQRSNLRLCSHADNMRNSKIPKNNTSGYKGVGFLKRSGRWNACIYFMNKRIHIGNYTNKDDAARAYDTKATELYGEFARLNFG